MTIYIPNHNDRTNDYDNEEHKKIFKIKCV
jgi:hypothetical protein